MTTSGSSAPGSYVDRDGRIGLVTCEHVARDQPMHYRLRGSDDVFSHPGPWTAQRAPIDAAFAPMAGAAWQECRHQAAAIPDARFAAAHRIAEQAELLFFRGYSGENAHYGFEVHEANGSGYCSQEAADTGDAEVFEMFWKPGGASFTSGTAAAARAEMKFEDPSGFSGSLVWNTRYLEVTAQGRQWSPEHAVVTGLLQRWDEGTGTLLALRVEHLRRWLEGAGL